MLILLQDVFFNDLRDPSAIDYSEPIFDWLRNSKDEALKKWESITTGELQQKQKEIVGDVTGQLPKFKTVYMHTTRFCDLSFQLGAAYLYCHQVRFLLPRFHYKNIIVRYALISYFAMVERNGFM